MTKNKGKIHFIITGGTIDSTWSGKSDTAIPNEHSFLPKFFSQMELYEEREFTEICLKDSRNLTRDDIKKVLEAIEASPYQKIIVTHGTYTMPDTARFIQANLIRHDQVIIIMGSMTPLKGFEPSDASFNLGYAISKSQDLDPGVYLCMNGKTFLPDEVAKSLSEGKFYSVFSDEQ